MEKRLVAFVVAFRTRDGDFNHPQTGIVSYSIDEGGPRPKSNYYEIPWTPGASVDQVWAEHLAKVKEKEGVA